MIKTYLFLPLSLIACTVPPASTNEALKAAVTWPVEPYKPSEPIPIQTKKPSTTITVPELIITEPCKKEELDKTKTDREQILKKLDCLLERKQ